MCVHVLRNFRAFLTFNLFLYLLISQYIEYSAAGTPLNWIEGRKPPDGIPPDAKPLSKLTDSELVT